LFRAGQFIAYCGLPRASTRASLRQRQHVLGLVLAKQPDHAGVSACAALPYRRACPPPRFLPGLRQNSPANCLQSRSFPSLKDCHHNSEKKEALPSIPEIGTPLPCITVSGTSVREGRSPNGPPTTLLTCERRFSLEAGKWPCRAGDPHHWAIRGR
jgi:hypothetical protein